MSASHEKRPTEEEQKRQHERQHPISSGQQGHGPNFCLILNPVFFSGLMALEKVGLWVWRFHTATSFWHGPHLPWFHRNLTGHFRLTYIQAENTRKPACSPQGCPRKPPPSVPRRHTIWLSSRKPWCWDAVVSSLAIRSNRVQSREVPERHTPALPSRSWSLVHSELEKLLRPKKESKYNCQSGKPRFFFRLNQPWKLNIKGCLGLCMSNASTQQSNFKPNSYPTSAAAIDRSTMDTM